VSELPSGTVTFLFTDLEGSTRLWQDHPDAMKAALARHDAIVRDAIESHRGHVVKTTGDGFHAAFGVAHDALDAAVDAQLALAAEPWGATGPLVVRMGVHTGPAELRDGDYYGTAVNRAARLTSVAHGGQIVVSLATEELVEESGVELADLGEHVLRDLSRAERVFQVVHPELASDFPALRSLDSFPSNLPLQLTAFVGRDDELAEIVVALDGARVVTLTGIGGVGKTRLALQAAAQVVANFRDGAWLCELAPVGDPGAVVEAIATALGVQPRPGRTLDDSLVDFLRIKQLLLVLDNCEHLLDSVTDVVERLVRSCARLTVLVTSREGLALGGERILALRSLHVPDADADPTNAEHADAVRLFVERGADARAGFALRDDNVAAVVQICRRLDGIPLAIELAAARVGSMTPQEIATRLDDQFRLLRGGTRGGVERHQTLRRAIDWSYDLLTPAEQLVLDRMSVFAGGCALEDAEDVVAGDGVDEYDVVDHLGSLVRRSLVLADDDAGRTRYRLLETVRQYAHERLERSGAAEAVQLRHALHYAGLAQEAGPNLRGAGQLAWIARLNPEIDNLRAAQSWAVAHDDLDTALAVIVPLLVTGIAIYEAALEWATALSSDLRVDSRPSGDALLLEVAFGAIRGADLDRANAFEARRRDAEAARGTPFNPANFRAQANIFFRLGDPADAVDGARLWVEHARQIGDGYDAVLGLIVLGGCTAVTDPPAGLAVLQEGVDEARRVANPSLLSWALTAFGLQLMRSDPTRAVPVMEEAIEISMTVGNRQTIGVASSALGHIHIRLGNPRVALRYFPRAMEVQVDLGDRVTLGIALGGNAQALATLGDDEGAATLLGAADAIMYPKLPTIVANRESMHSMLADRLDGEEFTALRRRGAAMADEEALAYARSRIDLIEAGVLP
jgi:predicted ATPase/class 3 adenylate cyclase